MIEAEFFSSNGEICGFCISGHSGYSEEGSDIICASVSSAAYMTANTVTEILGLNPKIDVADGFLKLELKPNEAKGAQTVMLGFKFHLLRLEEQYSDYIVTKFSEV